MLFELSAPPFYLPSFHLCSRKLDGRLQGFCGHTKRSLLLLAYPIGLGWKSGGGTVTNMWRKLTIYTLKDDVRLSTLPTNCDNVYLLTHGREDNCYSQLYYIKNQQDATLAVLFISNCKITLHVSDAFCVHHQEY